MLLRNMTMVTTKFLSEELVYQLKDGINYVGAHARNSIRLNPEISPKFLCILIVGDDHVLLRVADGEVITCGGTPIDNLMIYSAGRSAPLSFGAYHLRVERVDGNYRLTIERYDPTLDQMYPAR